MKLRSAVTLDTPVSECERILVENGEGCIPVVSNYDEPKKQWRSGEFSYRPFTRHA